MSASADELVEVRLLNLPVRIQQLASAHHDALVREFALIRASSTSSSLPARLLELIEELQHRFEQFALAPRATLQRAAAAGEPSVDLTYMVPRDAGEAVVKLSELLDEADEYCRAGEHLVTLAASRLVVAYRHWFVDEFNKQVRGETPRAWEMPAMIEHPRWPTTIEGDHASVALTGELDLASAPGLRDQLNELHTIGVRSFVLDTSDVEFIDSVGLSVILALYRRCREEEGSVTITSPSRVMQRTLEVAGLIEVLDVRT